MKKKYHYISTLDILGGSIKKVNILRKIEKILFYAIYVLIAVFLSDPYLIKFKKAENIILIVDNSYSTSIKFNNTTRFAHLIEKARKTALEFDKKNLYYINYDLKKRSVYDKEVPSRNILNHSLLRFFIESNLKIGNIVVFYSDIAVYKKNIINDYKNHNNFYYYIIGGLAKNYCISRISYKSRPFKNRKIKVFFENYGIEFPETIYINGKKKKIKNNKIVTSLSFQTKFLKIVLPGGDDCSIDNQIHMPVYNMKYKIKHEFKTGRKSFLTRIEKLLLSKNKDTILVTDIPITNKYYKIIYTGLSPTQITKNISFQNVIFFEPELFYGINKLSFLKQNNIPHFVFLEGRPLLSTNRGYLILEENGNIFTSFKIDESITTNMFWDVFLWKRIIEYAVGRKNIVKSDVSLFSKCDLSSVKDTNKELTKQGSKFKYHLQHFIKKLLIGFILSYLLLLVSGIIYNYFF